MLSWIRIYVRPVGNKLATVVAMGAVRIAASLFFVYISKSLIDIATGLSDRSFSLWATLMVLSIVLQLSLSALISRTEKICSQKLQNTLRQKIFDRLLNSIWQGREQRHSGDTMNRLERDVKDLSEFISEQLPSFVVTIIQFCAAFVFLLTLDTRLAWLLVGVLPLFLLISKLWYAKLKRLAHEVRASDSAIEAHMQESIQESIVIKTHNAQKTTLQRLDSMQDVLMWQTERQARVSFYSRLILSLGFACGYLLTFIYGAWQIEQGLITYGVMVAFLQLVGQIQRPIAQAVGIVAQLSTASTAAERLGELNRVNRENRTEDIIVEGICGVRLEQISFRYSDTERLIFEGFSYNFAPGTRTIVTGRTGAGKSTLLRLILGLIEPSNGQLSIYSHEGISVKTDASTRTNFVYVPQGNSLLSGSVRENLLLANPNASQHEIKQALYTAMAEFVYDLPEGIDTQCAESAATISEGQAQRIAIARALLGKGSVMIFDEFTSALDMETERELIARLGVGYTDRTMIFITHRLSAFEKAGFEQCRIEKIIDETSKKLF